MKFFERLLVTALILPGLLVLCGHALAAEDLAPADGSLASAPDFVTFKLIRLFPPKGEHIVGRFKLQNNGNVPVSVYGRRALGEIISVVPSANADTATILHRPAGGDWRAMTLPPNQSNASAEPVEIFPTQIQYLDIALPSLTEHAADEWMVRVVLAIEEARFHLDSDSFRVAGESLE